ncbi:hypothetical protein [Burkholderia ubonensis]|uniref:hypothetical protein n=1 Tax=Burkholderia ubonensis TaxID=101571 RepID=UPI000A51FA0B|nr:hypothetical protein [Burkholderia ubonensis]
MKLSAIITATTRKLHGLAVRTHLASLRLTVAAAEAEGRAAVKVEASTRSYAKLADQVALESAKRADAALVHSLRVREAAAQEAANIGGSL